MDSRSSTSSSSMAKFHSHSSCMDSRRSVDWRDSGIVIDEDHQFNSIDAICDFGSSSRSSCCPLERIIIDQDDDGDTILHLAVVGCGLDKVKDLIKICDLDAINNMMQTPLHVATMANRPEMVHQLIMSGAKIDLRDRRGNTPLHIACQKGHREVAKIILTNSSPPVHRPLMTMANFDGQTCLHLAAIHDRREIIDLLVNHFDADPNCPDSKSGETIMHKALTNFNTDLVDFICKLDKHCNQADYSGRKPSDTIRGLLESGIDEVSKLIVLDRLINDRIRVCIDQDGCCADIKEQRMVDNEILSSISSSSSSSEYSDMDD